VTQLFFTFPPPAPSEPRTGIWPDLGRWMLGELEAFPRNVATDVRLVAEAHRRQVLATWGGTDLDPVNHRRSK
jgi:hypothetical protein